MDLQIFVEGMYTHLNMPKEIVDRIFPFIDELIELHFKFLEQLRYRQKEQTVVDTIADILLEQFSGLVWLETAIQGGEPGQKVGLSQL